MGSTEDNTERAQEALEQAASRFKLLTLATHDAVFDWDFVSHEIWRNENYQRLFGAPERSLDSDNWWLDRLQPEDRERVLTAQDAALSSEGNLFSLEFRLRRPDGSYADIVERSLIVRDAKGQVVRMIGALTDISERKRAEEALRESEDRYRDLVEHSGDLICTHDLNGRLLSVNQVAASSLGYTPDEMLEMPPREFLVPEVRDQFDAYLETIGRRGSARGLMVVQTRAGERRIWEYSNTLRTKGVPAPIIRGMAHDVTERVHAQKALRESQRRLELIARASNTGLWDWDPRTNLVYYSPEWKSQIGYAEHEISNRFEEWETRIHPEDLPGAIGRVRDYLANPQGEFENEFRLRHKDGSYRWILARASVLKDDHSKPYRMLGSHLDITERKRADEALKKSAQLLRDTGEMAKVGGWELDLSSKEVSWTEETCRIHGVEPGYKPKLEEAVNFYAPESRSALEGALKKAAETGEPYDLESLFIPRDSKDKIWVRSLGKAVWSGGKVVKLAGTFQNIDEYKKAEEALRESEKLYRLLAENVTDVIWTTDLDLRYTYISPSVMRLRSVTVEEAMAEKTEETLTPSSVNVAKRALAEELSKESNPQEIPFRSRTLELEQICKDGSTVWTEVRATFLRDSEGRPVGILGVTRDISARRRAEEALRESEARFRAIFENAAIGIALVDMHGHPVESNPALQEMLGYSTLELAQMAFTEFTHPADAQADWDLFTELVEGKRDKYQLDKRFYRKDGEVVWGHLTASLVRNQSGEPKYAIGMAEDISERKQAEEALRVSEAKFRALSECAAAAIFIYQGNRFLYANPAMEGITGYSQGELVKMNFWEIAHPDMQELARERELERQRREPVPLRYEIEILTKARETRWLDFSGARLELDGDLAVAGIAFDITERKRVEEKLRDLVGQLHALADRLQTVREEERARLAREIHDELGQALTSIKIDLGSLFRELGEGAKPLAGAPESILKLVDQTIGTVRRIASQLRPGILNYLGLPAAIEWATEEFQTRTGIKCHLEMQEEDITLDAERTTAIFRIFQETLTNVARHSGATELQVRLFRRNANTILEVHDNGVGIQPQHLTGTASLGILGMRERALGLGGQFEIAGRLGEGTTVSVSIPDPSSTVGG